MGLLLDRSLGVGMTPLWIPQDGEGALQVRAVSPAARVDVGVLEVTAAVTGGAYLASDRAPAATIGAIAGLRLPVTEVFSLRGRFSVEAALRRDASAIVTGDAGFGLHVAGTRDTPVLFNLSGVVQSADGRLGLGAGVDLTVNF